MFKKLNKKGFTLAELLVVVAIIAVLVAISIPIFTTQLEKSRQSTDAANIRAAYAEAMVSSLDNNGEGGEATTDSVMQSDKWDKMPANSTIGDVAIDTTNIPKTKGQKVKCTISSDGKATFEVVTGSQSN